MDWEKLNRNKWIEDCTCCKGSFNRFLPTSKLNFHADCLPPGSQAQSPTRTLQQGKTKTKKNKTKNWFVWWRFGERKQGTNKKLWEHLEMASCV